MAAISSTPIASERVVSKRSVRFALGFRRLAYLVLAVLGLWVLYQSLTIEVRYYDTYDYLNDARALTGDPGATFYSVHSPLLPMLALPSALAWDPAAEGARAWLAWRVPHLTAGLLFALALAATGLFAARIGGRRWAVLAVVVVGCSPAVLHYAPHLLTDIPAMGLAALVLGLFDRHAVRPTPGGAVLLGGATGLAVAVKYSMAVLPVAVALAALYVLARPGAVGLVRGGGDRLHPRLRLFVHYVLAGAIASAVFGGLVYARYALTSADGFRWITFRADLEFAQEMVRPIGEESSRDYAAMLPRALGWLVGLLALVGVPLAAARRGLARVLAPLGFAAFFVASMGASVGMTQIRYMFPIFPVIAAFALVPIQVAFPWRRTGAGAAVLASVVLASSVWLGARQLVRDAHPFYRRPVQRVVARRIVEHVPPEGTVYWAGYFVAMSPPDPVVFPRDEFFSFFHFGHPGIGFLTRRRVVSVEPGAGSAHVANDVPAPAMVVGAHRFHHAADLQAGHPLPHDFVLHYRDGGTVRQERFPCH